MVAQAILGSGKAVEINAVFAAAVAPAGDAVCWAVVVKGFVGEVGVEGGVCFTRTLCNQFISRFGLGRIKPVAIVGCCRADLLRAAIKQRVIFHFVGNKRFDFQIGQREQLYCLLQLRRHHQRLRLP